MSCDVLELFHLWHYRGIYEKYFKSSSYRYDSTFTEQLSYVIRTWLNVVYLQNTIY